jgi:hypothetical protein
METFFLLSNGWWALGNLFGAFCWIWSAFRITDVDTGPKQIILPALLMLVGLVVITLSVNGNGIVLATITGSKIWMLPVVKATVLPIVLASFIGLMMRFVSDYRKKLRTRLTPQ